MRRVRRARSAQVVEEKVVVALIASEAAGRVVRRENDVRVRPEPALARQRLGHHHVEDRRRGTTPIQRGEERALVDERASSDVDQDRALGHRAEERGVDERGRLRVPREGESTTTSAEGRVVEKLVGRDDRVDRFGASRIAPAPDDAGAERTRPHRNRLTDRAEADDQPGRPRDLAELVTIPRLAALRVAPSLSLLEVVEHRPHHELTDRDVGDVCVREPDAPFEHRGEHWAVEARRSGR